jgi:hypothetical protein
LRCLQIATAKENTLALSTKHGITGVEYGGIIETPHYQQQRRKTERLKQQARKFDAALDALRKEWIFVPPSNMTIILHQDAGAFPSGVSLSVNHEIGRVLLHRRAAQIVERDDFSIDAVIDGSLEDAFEAMQW